MEEVTGRVHTGTRLLAQAGPLEPLASAMPAAPAISARSVISDPSPAPVPTRGTDGKLLAVVPIPGTGTSLAIVGYPVTTPGAPRGRTSPDGAAPSHGGAARASDGDRAGLLLDHDQRRVWVNGQEVTLTFQEFELLAYLSAHPSTVFSRADLARQVWQRDFSADSRTVDVHVSRVRHKLGPVYGRCLVTEYRVGYQFRPPAPAIP